MAPWVKHSQLGTYRRQLGDVIGEVYAAQSGGWGYRLIQPDGKIAYDCAPASYALHFAKEKAVRRATPRPKRILVAERGLENTRRNRQWLAVLRVLDDSKLVAGGQERVETLAWDVVKTVETTR